MTQALRPSSPRAIPARQSRPTVGRPLSRAGRAGRDRAFVVVCVIAAGVSVLVLAVLLASIFWSGWSHLTWQFLTGVPSRDPSKAGILPAMAGTFAICAVCAVTAVPIGVATAILLEEFKPAHGVLRRLHLIVQLNITNLAGVPSIVYGILGLTVFVQLFNLAGTQQAPAFEAGVRFFDRYTTVDGRTALVPVDAIDAPVTPIASVTRFVDEQGEPIKASVVDAAGVGGRVRDAEDRLDAFGASLEAQIDDLRTLDAAALGPALTSTWEKVGVPTELHTLAPTLTSDVAAAIARPGREGKKALRIAVRSLASTLAAQAFPDAILSDATPSRVREPKPWYVRVPFGRSVMAGGLTLMLVVLPIIIISTQEALRAVSDSMRRASLALGATKWQTIWNVTLPSALPGVMTGVILAMSRAIGEAAPILIIAGIVYITFVPGHLMDDSTAMPLQIYQWVGLPQSEFHAIAAAGIILLLAVLLCFNAVAIVIRQRTQKQL